MKSRIPASVPALLLLLAGVAAPSCSRAFPEPAAPHAAEIAEWQASRLDRLQAEDGWLSLVALHWLDEGENRFGTGPDADLVLPEGTTSADAGRLLLKNGTVRVRAAKGTTLTLDGESITRRVLNDDHHPDGPDILRLNELYLYIIKRGDRYAVRVKDPNSPVRTGFQGLEYFPVRVDFRMETKLVRFEEPREMLVPNVTGMVGRYPAPGEVMFRIDGKEWRLTPVFEDPDDTTTLFFIFADATNGRTTYGAGRFVYADLGEDDRLVLDFNKSYTPPCAFTSYATCPLPPPENRLEVPIEAGEKFSVHH